MAEVREPEGTERCPTCKSDDPKLNMVQDWPGHDEPGGWASQDAVLSGALSGHFAPCPDPWHSTGDSTGEGTDARVLAAQVLEWKRTAESAEATLAQVTAEAKADRVQFLRELGQRTRALEEITQYGMRVAKPSYESAVELVDLMADRARAALTDTPLEGED